MMSINISMLIIILSSICISCKSQDRDVLKEVNKIYNAPMADTLIDNLKKKSVEFKKNDVENIFQEDIEGKIQFYSKLKKSDNSDSYLINLLADQKFKKSEVKRVVIWIIASSGELVSTETYLFIETI